MIASLLATFINDLGVAALAVLFGGIVGFAGALIWRFGGRLARTSRELFQYRGRPARRERLAGEE